jgi:hypothetical protein
MIDKMLERSFQKKADRIQKKTLQVVNLAPSEAWVERIVEIHPMRQIFWASIIQLCVFGFMLLSFWAIGEVVN